MQRDVTHVSAVCQKQYGHDDRRVGRLLRARRATHPARRAGGLGEGHRPDLTPHQRERCKTAIHAYGTATRTAATANLRYLDSHRRTALTKMHGDVRLPDAVARDEEAPPDAVYAVRFGSHELFGSGEEPPFQAFVDLSESYLELPA